MQTGLTVTSYIVDLVLVFDPSISVPRLKHKIQFCAIEFGGDLIELEEDEYQSTLTFKFPNSSQIFDFMEEVIIRVQDAAISRVYKKQDELLYLSQSATAKECGFLSSNIPTLGSSFKLLKISP